MLYRLRRQLSVARFDRAIRAILDAPPIRLVDYPLSIVSMVGKSDVRMYLLAIKSLYARIRRGKVVAIIARDTPQQSRDLLEKHVPGIELVVLEDIPTGDCQRGGTWERLLYILDLAQHHYVIQLDSDTLSVGSDLDEVVHCIESNTSFTISNGFDIMPLADVVREADITKSKYIGILVERMFRNYPDAHNLRYVRGSSGFSGFARGCISRAAITDFHRNMEKLVGFERWREWGTEQCASNFVVANSDNAVVLPFPEYVNFGPLAPRIREKFIHFIGAHRFLDGYYVTRAGQVIAELCDKRVAIPRLIDREKLPGKFAFARALRTGSAMRYAFWQMLGNRSNVPLQLRDGTQFQLGPVAAGTEENTDAYEIFALNRLSAPIFIPPERVSLIVDLGASVGYSSLYWLANYPMAEVLAFEPRSAQAEQFLSNIRRNGLAARATLAPPADSSARSWTWASTQLESFPLPGAGQSSFQDDLTTILEGLRGRRIDILKIDTRVAEYQLFEDPRFAQLDVRSVVLVQHSDPNLTDGRKRYEERSAELGYRLFPTFNSANCSVVWCYRGTFPGRTGNRAGAPIGAPAAVRKSVAPIL